MKSSQIILINNHENVELRNFLQKSELARDFLCKYFANNFGSNQTQLFFSDEQQKNIKSNANDKYVIITNGCYYTQICSRLVSRILGKSSADIIILGVEKKLKAYTESAKVTSEGLIAGFHRLFENTALKNICPSEIHHIFVKKKVFEKEIANFDFTDIGTIYQKYEKKGLVLDQFCIAGEVAKLKNLDDFHKFFKLNHNYILKSLNNKYSLKKSKKNKFTGNVLVDDNVTIHENVKIIGPSMICRGAVLSQNSIIDNSIIGAKVEVNENSFVKNDIVVSSGDYCFEKNKNLILQPTQQLSCKGYRKWHRFSYPVLGKRIFDIIFSLIMIVIFAPIWVIVTLAIKLNSPGPVFFTAIRQGRHGKQFKCLKFRSMMTGADNLQRTLRIKNEVDGPQFKITDDPRISSVGSFLRDTSLDEIPQFFNVLFGQMSIVGPRPSPEAENMKCPYWRDARLSVKPGITGLWQIMRTREPNKDFQEWVYYDTKYVREITFKKDLWICYKTALMLIKEFVDRF